MTIFPGRGLDGRIVPALHHQQRLLHLRQAAQRLFLESQQLERRLEWIDLVALPVILAVDIAFGHG